MAELLIHLGRQKKTFRATLLTQDAPQTVAGVSEMLGSAEVSGLSYHSIYSGQEFYVYCPPVPIPLENHIVWPKPGQILYYYFPPRTYAGMHVHGSRIAPGTAGAEIALWYGQGDLRVVTESGIRGNLFAEVVPEELADFQAAGDTILAEGRETVEFALG